MESKVTNSKTTVEKLTGSAEGGRVNNSEPETVASLPEYLQGTPLFDPKVQREGRIIFIID